MKYFRYYFRIIGMCFMDQLANRGNFITWVVIYLFSLAINLIFFRVIFSEGEINGWTERQALLVYGTALLTQGIGSMTFFCFMYFFSDDISKGDLDFRLIKPMDTQFLAVFPYIDLEDIGVIPTALLVLIYFVGNTTLPNIAMFLLLIISGLLIIFSLITFIESMAFKTVQITSAYNFIWSIISSSKYPIKAIRNVFPPFLVILFPMILIASVPAQALFGKFEWNWIFSSLALAISLFILSRLVFQKGLKTYSSASS